MSAPSFIWDEHTVEDKVPPGAMDRLWAKGWRHFGRYFFRYNFMLVEHTSLRLVVPLRIPLDQFAPSKSQRRVLRRNEDVAVRIVPAIVTPELEAMFHRHKTRFQDNVPEGLHNFLSEEPATVPCECLSVMCELEGACIAVSYCDVGDEAASSVYALFEPDHAERGLGTLTMLKEIEWCQARGLRYFYPGYATRGSSVYDYKKRFLPLEGYDWQDENWKPLAEIEASVDQVL